jgi:hypothetical protein
MPPHANNKTALATLKTAITTFETDAYVTNRGTGNSPQEIRKLCRELRKQIAWFEDRGSV